VGCLEHGARKERCSIHREFFSQLIKAVQVKSNGAMRSVALFHIAFFHAMPENRTVIEIVSGEKRMVPKYSLTFHEAEEPITGFVTKFGGQPIWYGEPQWPLSRSTGEPMEFICQIALDPHLFGNIPGRMAYLFMAEDGDTWDPESGDNAVIIQPGICDMPVEPLLTGPVSIEGEFAVELTPGEDPDSLVEDEAVHASEEAWEEFTAHWNEDKIGGTPAFLQGPEFPANGNWKLLLQLDSTNDLFWVNFGDAGVGYAFLSEDGTRGKFLWQCL
jgi:hypothetical protein